MVKQEQNPRNTSELSEQSDRAANAFTNSIGNAVGLCDVKAPRVGKALRDLFIADTKLFFAPLTYLAKAPGKVLRAIFKSSSDEKR